MNRQLPGTAPIWKLLFFAAVPDEVFQCDVSILGTDCILVVQDIDNGILFYR